MRKDIALRFGDHAAGKQKRGEEEPTEEEEEEEQERQEAAIEVVAEMQLTAEQLKARPQHT